MADQDLHGPAVPFVQSEKEKRHHHRDHGQRGEGDISRLLYEEKERHANSCGRPETDELASREIQKHLALDPREITGDICIQIFQNANLLKTAFSQLLFLLLFVTPLVDSQ